MVDITPSLLFAGVALLLIVIIFQIALLRKKTTPDLSPVNALIESVHTSYEKTERVVREEIARNREESASASQKSRDELGRHLAALTQSSEHKLEQVRLDSQTAAQTMRDEVNTSLKNFNDSMLKTMTGISDGQKNQLDKLVESNQSRLDALRVAVEQKLKGIQDDNATQLEKMRSTVDEKLQGTLEKRLGESFKLVSDRLEQVHKGLGEMQVLATGVGDLKKVLTNVKTRGTFGEVQLAAMLEQVMTPEQYGINIDTKGSGERVEFAIKFPGRSGNKDEVVWLPIDAKFPTEDYQRLVEAQEKADPEAAEVAIKQLESRVKNCAQDICEKYISAPKTTDFGILFLPTEGLFAEVVRRIGLTELIQTKYHVIIAGPTTLFSILNSLQMGFRTLVIQQRSSEVWNLLASVKTEFGRYGDVLDKVHKKLHEATTTIDTAAVRTRAIERKLRDVQELPAPDATHAALLVADADGPAATVDE